MANHLLNNQNILKDIFEDKRGQWQKWWRRERVEMRLEFFESLNGITHLLLWKLFRSKWLFSWMSVRWILRLPDSENDLEHSLQGRGGIVLLNTNGFSPKMASPHKMASPQKWLLPRNEKMALKNCELHWIISHYMLQKSHHILRTVCCRLVFNCWLYGCQFDTKKPDHVACLYVHYAFTS